MGKKNRNSPRRVVGAAVIALLLAGLTGCGRSPENGCRPDPAADAPGLPVAVQHLEKPFLRIKTTADARQFLDAYPDFARRYLQREPGRETQLLGLMATMAPNPALQQLGREAAAAFPDSAALGRELGAFFGRTRFYFPDFKAPKVVTFNSGLGFIGKDIFANDSLLVVSTEWFAGPKASRRPDLPGYMLRRYAPAYVLPAVALAVASKYNRHELRANTVLDAMVREGKALYFAGQVLPCTPDSLLLGYSAKELASLKTNEPRVWGHFLEKDLLYATTPFLVQKYVAERPNVPEIDRTCPGRVGQWVGLQIVRKYAAEHPDVTLARLMGETNAQRILNDSHYRPRKQ